MKVVVWFFSLWLLVLTGLPCPDADCHAHTTSTTQSPTSHADDDPDHKAPCSPFCHCTTCSGFSIPRLFQPNLPDQPSISTVVPQVYQYQSPASSTVTFAIWQPPKF